MEQTRVERAFEEAKELYAERGIDVDAALKELASVSLSLPCWEGDDLAGFETPDAVLSGGGIAVTGNYPGRARNIDELRADLEQALSLIPGRHRVNIHAKYGDFRGAKVERDKIGPRFFESWADWAEGLGLALDFNATCYGHPLAESGYTLASGDERVRKYWVEHVKRCREISAWLGRRLKTACIHDLWIPDGSKEGPVARLERRTTLMKSLDEIFETEFPAGEMKDAVESKLFGIGSESFVAGSHEFYLGWAITRRKMLCIDTGHYHPTESIADKISALLLFIDELLMHVSRGVRWDSDHVVIFGDDLLALCQEIVRAKALHRVHLALDYFDGEMNRVGSWVLGSHATLKAILAALLEPTAELREREDAGDSFGRLALLEEMKAMPLGAVWDYHCKQSGAPHGGKWIQAIRDYENRVLRHRS